MSTLRTNALEGMDAKNSITIVAGAGNITTTNVQEGLMKAWMYYKQFGTTITDSFNTSSATDTSTGDFLHNYTNAFAGSYDFRTLGGTSFVNDKVLSHGSTGASTTAQQFNVYDVGNGAVDDSFCSTIAGGDLA